MRSLKARLAPMTKTPDPASARRPRGGRAGQAVARFVAANDRFFGRMSHVVPTFAAAAFMAGMSAYGVALSGEGEGLVDALSAAAGFEIKKIEISGVEETGAADVLAMMGIRQGRSILTLDVGRARDAVAGMSWVQSVEVKKLYPDRVVVRLTERKPFALWQSDGRVSIIDRDGVVLAPLKSARHSTLPLVVGAGANLRAREIVAALDSHPMLAARVRAAVLVADRRWNLVTRDHIEIRLPDDDPAMAVAELAAIDGRTRVLDRDVTVIDMRTRDWISLRLGEDALKGRDAAAKKRGTGA